MSLNIPPPQRPPSRSERLLRETLRRDEEVRDSTTSPPSRRTSLSRHSHAQGPAPTSPALSNSSSRPSSPALRCRYTELADEQYTRGTFLFRSAITNAPNSPPQTSHPIYYPAKMESLVERSTRTDPSAAVYQAHTATTPLHFTMSVPHTPTYSRSPTRSASPSHSAALTRRQSLQRTLHHDTPLLSPQEQALRSRLECMLHIEDTRQQQQQQVSQTRPNKERRRRSHCSNEVRDEMGGWPWRDRDWGHGDGHGRTRSGSASRTGSGASILSFPPASNISLHSRSSLSLQDHSSCAHVRSRSQTDPILPPPHVSSRAYSHSISYSAPRTNTPSTASMSTLSPRKSTTPYHQHLYSHQLQQQHAHQHRHHQAPIEATPPLTADASPTGTSEGNELEPDYHLDADDDDARLITPPPTPPPTYHHSSHRKSLTSAKTPHSTLHPHPHSPSPYRPVGEWYPSFGGADGDEDGDGDGAQMVAAPYPHPAAMRSPRAQSPSTPGSRPQFNVRKASEQCKMIEGYVSFLSVEGLGGPPESDAPGMGEEEGEGAAARNAREKRVFGIGWNGWKSLLPLGGGVQD
ncbi:hypothetical protein AX17_002409 [Amanita inopinata Kibby_2008]|nr:hypothetical protein AX17_002409 [Amanita inopinata Kibby_2008]